MSLPSFTSKVRTYIRNRDNSTCFYCKIVLEDNEVGETAHIVPISYGAPSIPSNGIFSHKSCNRLASNKIDVIFINEAIAYVTSCGDVPTWIRPSTSQESYDFPVIIPLLNQVYDRDKHTCLFCQTITEIEDGKPKQVIPSSLDGYLILDNSVWCCNDCYHLVKGQLRMHQALNYLHSIGSI